MGPQPWELRKPWPVIPPPMPSQGFNGAAALGAAETITGDVGGGLGNLASMGPQPWELRKRPLLFTPQRQLVANYLARTLLLGPAQT
jgi:hypothetical protein